ncbi:hypothetical protein [Sphingobium chungangianum]
MITPPTNHSPLYAPVADRLSASGTTALVMSVLAINGVDAR